jgi:hypothetical protein
MVVYACQQRLSTPTVGSLFTLVRGRGILRSSLYSSAQPTFCVLDSGLLLLGVIASLRTSPLMPREPSRLVWRPEVGELGEEVLVWPHPVLRYLPVCQECQKGIDHIVGEQTAVVRVGDRPRVVVWQDIR